MSGYIHPQDIISYFVEHDGRSSNTELVRHFGEALTASHLAPNNKKILKKLTGYIATVRRQGTIQGASGPVREGKLLVLKNRFHGRSADDIWSSLVLSLSREELQFLVPDQPQPPLTQEENVSAGPGKGVPPLGNPSLEKDTDGSKRQAIYYTGEQDVTLEGLEQLIVTSPQQPLRTSTPLPEDMPPSRSCSPERMNVDVLDSVAHAEGQTADNSSAADDGPAAKTLIAAKSVRDLKKAFDSFASTSNVSILDHVVRKQNEPEKAKTRRIVRPQSEDFGKHLSPEGWAWTHAALRQDYNTLYRLATSNPSLVTTREPANGYTALHWAARRGNVELVKLLAGRFNLSPDVRSRGGYTPLMMAAMAKSFQVYDLLTDTYQAREDIRDYSGHTASYYLENHIQVPGFPPTLDFSHAVDMVDRGGSRATKERRGAGRQHFIRGITDTIRTSLRDGIKESFREVGDVRESLRDLRQAAKRRTKSSSTHGEEEYYT